MSPFEWSSAGRDARFTEDPFERLDAWRERRVPYAAGFIAQVSVVDARRRQPNSWR